MFDTFDAPFLLNRGKYWCCVANAFCIANDKAFHKSLA